MYGIKYSYLILIIYTQFKQLFLFNDDDYFFTVIWFHEGLKEFQ